jgi:hypothetical protein
MELEPIRSHTWTPEQVEIALTTLATAGTSTRASKQLEQIDIHITPEQLRSMRNRQYPNRYAVIQAQLGPELRKRREAGTLAAATALEAVELAAIEQMAESIQRLDPRDIPAAVKNITTAKAINIDKHLVQSGLPNQITEHRDAGSLLAQLRDVIDTTAVEETPAALEQQND